MHSLGTLLRFIWRSSKRAAVFVLGLALLTVGLIMFVTPGPGIVLVVAGLAVLATEFAWAEHLLDKAKEQAARAGQSAQRIPVVAKATAAAGRLVPRRWRRTAPTGVAADGTTLAGAATAGGPTVSIPATAGDAPRHDRLVDQAEADAAPPDASIAERPTTSGT